MAEAIRTNPSDPSLVIEAEHVPGEASHQAISGSLANKTTADSSKNAEHRGKVVAFSSKSPPPGTRFVPKGKLRRSRSRGRSLSRHSSHRHGPITDPPCGSDLRTSAANQANKERPGSSSLHTPAQVSISWVNVAKALTKGYNLAYVPPLVENGEIIVDITPEVAAEESPRWLECLVGHFIGKKVPFKLTEEAVKKAWGDQVVDIKLHENGFYFFRVPDVDFRKKILDMGPISIFSCTLVLQQWHPKMTLKKGKMDSIPVWVKLRDIPSSLWSPAGIGRIASAIGKPLYVDTQTEQMSRISYARVCIEITATQPRLEFVKFRWDGEINSISVEYEWKPLVCSSCGIFGHKPGTKGFECAPLQLEPRPQATSRSQAVEEWTVVRRKKGNAPTVMASEQRQHSSALNLNCSLDIEVPPAPVIRSGASLPSAVESVAEPEPVRSNLINSKNLQTGLTSSPYQCPASTPAQQRMDSSSAPYSAGPGPTKTAPGIPSKMNSGGVAPLAPSLHSTHDQESLRDAQSSPGVPISETLPSAASGPQDRLQQQIEDFDINSQTSSEASSSAHAEGANSDSDEQTMGEHTVISPPTTRSRTLASYYVEAPSKASVGPTVSGPSSSKKKDKKRRPRRSRR